MAQEIAAQYNKAERFQTWTHEFMMQRLMELVAVSAAAERDACATVCEKMRSETPIGKTSRIEALFFAARAIRARGNT
jgi:hypothetical protein